MRAQHGASDAYVNYVLTLLFLVAVLNVCDRTIIAVLVEDIRADLALNDREMGLVMGLAFSVTYFAAGIPLARLADTGSRRTIIACALAAWSVMTALAGLAQNFLQLLLTRMGVGLGEAGGSPPSHSLIADYVAPQRRARAMSLLSIGAIVGMGLGTLYGGWASQTMGWRMALITVGAPGVVLAVIFALTVRDPPRRPAIGGGSDHLAGSSLAAVLRSLARNRGFVLLTAAASLVSMVGIGKGFWEPTFLRRVYGMSAAEAGGWYFLISPLPSMLGAYLLALLTDRLARGDPRWYAWMSAGSALMTVPLGLMFYLLPESVLLLGVPAAFLFSIAGSFFGAAWAPAIMALVQGMVPPSARAVAAASWSMVASLIGTGIGPLLVGDMNMRLEAEHGDTAVRYSLALMAAMPLLAALLFMALARELRSGQGQP